MGCQPLKYEYKCTICGMHKDFDFPMGQAPEKIKEPVIGLFKEDTGLDHTYKRQFQVAGVLFKGHGFHRTDYPNSKGRKYAT